MLQAGIVAGRMAERPNRGAEMSDHDLETCFNARCINNRTDLAEALGALQGLHNAINQLQERGEIRGPLWPVAKFEHWQEVAEAILRKHGRVS